MNEPKMVSKKDIKKAIKTDADEEDEIDTYPGYMAVKSGGLQDQNMLICVLCRSAIHNAEVTLLTKDAWPELHCVGQYRVKLLIETTRQLEGEDSRYRDIRRRIKKDEDYVKALSKWVRGCIRHYHTALIPEHW